MAGSLKGLSFSSVSASFKKGCQPSRSRSWIKGEGPQYAGLRRVVAGQGEQMPRLAKGAKWTFGWVVVGPRGSVPIPPDAWLEYGFQSGEEALLTPGSRTSAGFGLSSQRLMSEASKRLGGRSLCTIGQGYMEDGQLILPPGSGISPGDVLLAVRGSRYGLGFVAQGPIYEEASRYTGALSVFEETGGGRFVWRLCLKGEP
jgi:hypothetical protein